MVEHRVVKSPGSGSRLCGSGPDATLTRWGTLSAFLNSSASVSSTVE